jgi:hypothetical protein
MLANMTIPASLVAEYNKAQLYIVASLLPVLFYYTFRIMGCGASKQPHDTVKGDYKKDADRYARRKQNNFKDSALERHMQECVNQKKKLRHVEDPEIARKKRMENIKQEQKKKPTDALGLSEDELQKKLANLKRRS